jgi:type VI secretion system protein VasI
MNRLFLLCSILLAAPAMAQEDCTKIASDGERLACFDHAFASDEQDATDQNGVGKWTVSTDQSAMTDDTSVYVSLFSDNEIEGRFSGPGQAVLFLRCHENTTSAFVVFNDLFMSDNGGHGRLEYRIDKQDMAVINTSASNNNKALGLWSGGKSIPWIKKLLGKETLILRATPHSESSVTATFDIRGIDTAIADLRQTCGW